MQREIDLLIFDLDGTLIDSKKDIGNSVNYTMGQLGLPSLSEELISQYVGNGVTPLIQNTLKKAGGHSFEKALKIFLHHYDQHLLDTTHLFDGIPNVLENFKDKKMFVLTNKLQAYSLKILKGLGINHYFQGIFGADPQYPKKPNPSVVLNLLQKFRVKPHRSVIIGDSRIDMETGKNAGILRVGVTYGFRPRQELEEVGCDLLIERPEALIQLFG